MEYLSYARHYTFLCTVPISLLISPGKYSRYSIKKPSLAETPPSASQFRNCRVRIPLQSDSTSKPMLSPLLLLIRKNIILVCFPKSLVPHILSKYLGVKVELMPVFRSHWKQCVFFCFCFFSVKQEKYYYYCSESFPFYYKKEQRDCCCM